MTIFEIQLQIMTKEEIIQLIEEKHNDLFNWLRQHDLEKWDKGPEGKWTAGQHIRHLNQSMAPFNQALSIPKILLKAKFGVSNRETRSYEVMIEKYKTKLAANPGVGSEFSKDMGIPSREEKQEVIDRLHSQKNTMLKKLSKWKESDLDKYILPHPLLGRMPMREMFMFMAYHTLHHHRILEEKY